MINCYSQLQPIDVADLTLKVGASKTEELYYGFAEGDQIIFNFEEVNKKDLKEIEIIELPTNSKFMDYKTSKIVDKKINVYKKAIYYFRFSNSAITGRICRIKIQRIPKSESLINFNTEWKWLTQFDTTYINYTQDSLVGYDTLLYKETVKEIISTEVKEDLFLTETKAPISSTGWMDQNVNTKVVRIDLPQNQISDYETKNLIAWAYLISVGDESTDKYTTTKSIMKDGVSLFLSPLGAFAIGAIADLVVPTGTDAVFAALTDEYNKNLFLNKLPFNHFTTSKSASSTNKFSYPDKCQGTFYLCLRNDNTTFKIYVTINVVAIIEIRKYEDKVYDRMSITPRYLTLNKRRMVINANPIRVNAE